MTWLQNSWHWLCSKLAPKPLSPLAQRLLEGIVTGKVSRTAYSALLLGDRILFNAAFKELRVAATPWNETSIYLNCQRVDNLLDDHERRILMRAAWHAFHQFTAEDEANRRAIEREAALRALAPPAPPRPLAWGIPTPLRISAASENQN